MKHLWDIALEQLKHNENSNADVKDSILLLVGNKSGGKTTLCYKFLERSETPKSTFILEYLFGRRNKSIESGKEVCHIWELGGGTVFTELLEIPIVEKNLRALSVVLVLDLSKPEDIAHTTEMLLSSIEKCIEKALSQNTLLKSILQKQAKSRISDDHEDIGKVQPFPVPLLIIGSRYDLFQGFDPDKREVVCKCLRQLAHARAAGLLFVSSKSEALLSKWRTSLTALLFHTTASQTAILDYNKPLYVYPGNDSFQLIGPLTSYSSGEEWGPRLMEAIQQILRSHFPKIENKKGLPEDPAIDAHFKEPDIDVERAQKNQELIEYKKQTQNISL